MNLGKLLHQLNTSVELNEGITLYDVKFGNLDPETSFTVNHDTESVILNTDELDDSDDDEELTVGDVLARLNKAVQQNPEVLDWRVFIGFPTTGMDGMAAPLELQERCYCTFYGLDSIVDDSYPILLTAKRVVSF